MANLNNKINFSGDGKSLIEKVFSGKTLSEIKAMSPQERQEFLNPNSQNRQSVAPNLARRTSYEFVKSSKPESVSGVTQSVKSAPAELPYTPKPEGTVKTERQRRKSESTQYTETPKNTTQAHKKSVGQSVNFSVDNSSTEFISGTVDYSFPAGLNKGFDGDVYAIAQTSDGTLYVGGDFGNYYDYNDSWYSPYFASINPNGTYNDNIDTANLNGDVYAIAVQPDGKILLGGVFTTYTYGPGYSTNYIVRINPDGSFDNTFVIGDGFNDYVETIVIQPDGKILIGGQFTYYNGSYAGRIIRLNSNGSVDSSFTFVDEFNDNVFSIKLQPNGKILVGGQFTQYGGVSQNYISRLNSDGTIDSSFHIGDGFNNYVNSIDLQSDGKIIVGGNFWDSGYYDNNPCESIVRLNTDGSLDSTFGMGVSDEVTVIKVQSDDKILVGGRFSGFYPIYNNYSIVFADELIRYNADTTFDYSFYYNELLNGASYAIELQSDGKIIIGGEFYNNSTPSIYPLNYFGRLYNTIPNYTYVYSVIVVCPGNLTKTYSVGSNTEFSVNDFGKTISFKSLHDEVNVLCGYLSIGYNNYVDSTLYPYGIPEYVYVQTYDYDNCITCTMDNNKYVHAYNPLSDDYDYFYVNNKYEVGDFFFINETQLFTNIRGCFQIVEEQNPDGSDYSPITYVPYLTCEECVEANGVVYHVNNWDVMWETNIISYQYFDVNLYPAIILPNSPTHANYIAGSITYVIYNIDKLIPEIYSVPTFIDENNPIPPANVAKLQAQKGDGQLDYSFNGDFINQNNVGFDDWVFETKQQSDGKILVVGQFNKYNGVDVPSGEGFTRLNTDGTIDNDFSFDFNNFNTYGNTVATLSDGSVLIGGGLNYGGLHNPSGWVDQTDGDATVTREDKHWTLVGTNDAHSNGWSYVKRQFFEFGTLYINYDWFTDDGLDYDHPFYYVSSDEPVGNTNINFNDNLFVNSDSETGQINISYEPGDWVSIGVYSNDSTEGPGYLRISEYTGLVKVNQDGTPDTTFNRNVFENGGFNNDVLTISPLSDGTILFGGRFNGFDNYEVDGFVKLNSDGTINQDFLDTKVYFNNDVYEITVQDDGKILVGGNFDGLYDSITYTVYDVGYLVRLNSDGSLDFTFNSYTPATFSTQTPFSGVTAQYLKWTITGTKDIVTTTQVSELYLTLNGQQLGFNYGVVTCTNPDGTNPIGEGPENLVDDDINTKWTDTSFSANGYSYVIIDNGIPINFDGYKYYTGNDFVERDPITWTLDISNDGLTWTTVSTVSGATITDNRESSSPIFSVTPTVDFGGSIYVNESMIDADTDTGVWSLSDNDLTFEWFQKFEGNTTIRSTVFTYTDTYLSVYFQNGQINIYVNGDVYTYGLDEQISNNWWHFALTRQGNTWRIFQNGYQLGSFSNGITYGNAYPFRIGGPSDYLIDNNNQGFFTGYITNLRVTSNEALYTTDFIPPTQPLSHDNEVFGNTILLLSVLTANSFIDDSSDDSIQTSLVTVDTGFNDSVNVITLDSSGNVFVGGSFNYYNNQYIGNNLIKLDTYGVIDTSFTIGDGFNNDVTSIVIQPDGKILVGGFFTYYDKNNGYNSDDIIRLDQEGNPDLKFYPIVFGEGFSNPVMNIELTSEGNSIVSGWFNYFTFWSQVGSGGSVVKLFTADNFKLTHFDTCENNESDFLYLPYDSTIHTLDNFWTGSEDDDNHFVNLPLGFNVNFLGIDYTDVNISSNTYLTFGDGSSNCCFNIPNGIPGGPGLPGIFISINNMDAQLYNLYTGLTDNGNTFILKYEGSYHSNFRTDIPNLVVDYIFYKNDPYRIDVVIEQNDHYKNGDATSGVSDGINPTWLASFSATSQTAWKITDSSTIEELPYGYIQTNNDTLKGMINTTEAICGTVFGEENNTIIISGSNQFSGDDSLIVNNSGDGLYPRTSDFTIEWFQKRIDDDGQNSRPFSIGTYDNPFVTIAVSFENGYNFTLWLNDASYNFGNLSDTQKWSHFAITRQNDLIRVFYNGTEIFQTIDGANTGLPILFMGDLNNFNNDNLVLGNQSNPDTNGQFFGLITNFRYVLGRALYTSNFEVPVNPLTATYDTYVLLLSSTIDTLLDNSGDNYYNVTQSNWNGGPTDFTSTNPFDNNYKLFNSNGITHYSSCTTCLDSVMLKSIMYVSDGGVTPNRIERHSIKPSVITDDNNLGPIFTLRKIEAYEILNYFY
jgi:uncharacterized delta-60 repeat protein